MMHMALEQHSPLFDGLIWARLFVQLPTEYIIDVSATTDNSVGIITKMKTPLILLSFFLHWVIVSSGVQSETASGRIAEQRDNVARGSWLRQGNLVEAILNDVRRSSSTPQDGRQISRAHERGLTRREMGSVGEEATSGINWGGLLLREQEPKKRTSDLPPLISMLRSKLREPVSVHMPKPQNRSRRSLDQYSNSDYALTIDGSDDEAEVRKILANAKARLSTVKSDYMGTFQDNSFGDDWLFFVLPTTSGSFTDMLFKSQTDDYEWDIHDFDVKTNWMNSEHVSNVKDTMNYNDATEASKKGRMEDFKPTHSKWNMGMNQEYLGQLRTQTSWSNRDESSQEEAEPDRKNAIAHESRASEARKSDFNAIRYHNQWDEGRLIKSDDDRNEKEDYRDIKVNVKNGQTLFGDSRIDNTMVVGSDKPSTAELPVKIPEAHNKARQNKRPSNDKSLFISDPLVLLAKLEGAERDVKKSEESTAHESTPGKVNEGFQDRNSVSNEVQRNTTESYLDQESANDESNSDNATHYQPEETVITRDRKTSSVEQETNPQKVEDPDTLKLHMLIEELSKLREELNTGFDENDKHLRLRSSRLDTRLGVLENRDKHGGTAEISDSRDVEEHGHENIHKEREEQGQSVNGQYVPLGDYHYKVGAGGDVKYNWSSGKTRQHTVTVAKMTGEQLRVGNWGGMQDSGRKVANLERVDIKEESSKKKAEMQESEMESEISVPVEDETEYNRENDVNRHKFGSVNAIEGISRIGSKGREEYDVSHRIETNSTMEHSGGTGTELQDTNEGNRLKLEDLKGKEYDPEVAVEKLETESFGTKDAKRNKFGSLNMEEKEFKWGSLEGGKIWGENLENGKFKAEGPKREKARSKELRREKYDSEMLDKKKSGSMNLGKEEARLPVVEKFMPLPDYTLSNVNKSPMENEQKSEQSVSYGAQVNGGKNSILEHDEVRRKEGNNKWSEHDKRIIQINQFDPEKEGKRRTKLKWYEDNHYGGLTVSSGGDESFDEDFWNKGITYKQEDVYATHNIAFNDLENSNSDSDNQKYRLTYRTKPLNTNGELSTYENKDEQYEKRISYGETLNHLSDDITSASKHNLKEHQIEAGKIRSGKDEAKELELSSVLDDVKERNINDGKWEERLSWNSKINGREEEDDDEEDVKSKRMFHKDTSSMDENVALTNRGMNLHTDRLSGIANIEGKTSSNSEIHGKGNKARVLSVKINITGAESFNDGGFHKENNKALKNTEIYKSSTKEYKLNKLSKTSNIARDQIPDKAASTSDQDKSVNKISDPLKRFDDKKKTLSLDSEANQGTSLSSDVGTQSLRDPEGNDEFIVATPMAHVAELRDENKGFRWSENDTSGVEFGRSTESNSGTSATVNRTADKDQIEIRGSRVNLSKLSSTDVHAPEYSERLSKNDDLSVVSHWVSLNVDKGKNIETDRQEELPDNGKESKKMSDVESGTKSGNEAENESRMGPGKVSGKEFESESGEESGGRVGEERLIGPEAKLEIEPRIISEKVSEKETGKTFKKEGEHGWKISEKELRKKFNVKSETKAGKEYENVSAKESEVKSEEGPKNIYGMEPGKLPEKESVSGSEISNKKLVKASENESKTELKETYIDESGKKSGNESKEDLDPQGEIHGNVSIKEYNIEYEEESAGKSEKISGIALVEESEKNTEKVFDDESDELSEIESAKESENESVQAPEIIMDKGPENVTVKESETKYLKQSEKETEVESKTASEREFKEETEKIKQKLKPMENKWLLNRVTHGASETLSAASDIGATEEEHQMRKGTHVYAEKQEKSEKQITSDNSFDTECETVAQTVAYLDGIKINESKTASSSEAAKQTKSTRHNLQEAGNISKLHGTAILLPESIDPSVATQQHTAEINESKRSEGLDAPRENTGKGYERPTLNLQAGSLIESSIRNKELDLAEQREGKTVASDVNTVQASDSSSTLGSKFSGNSDSSREDNTSSAAINQVSKEEPVEEKRTGSSAAEDHSSRRNDFKMISNLSHKSSERNEVREEGTEKMASTRVKEELKGTNVKRNLSNSGKLPANRDSKEPRNYYSTRLDNPVGHRKTSLSDDEQSALQVSKIDPTNKSNDPWTSVTQKQTETTGRNGLNDPQNEEDKEEASLNANESITRDLNTEKAFKEGSPSVEVTESNDVTAESEESSPTANMVRTAEDGGPLSDLGIESSQKSDKLLRKGQGTLDRSSESGTRSGGDEITWNNATESGKYEAPSVAVRLIENKAAETLTATSVQTASNTETTGEARSTDVEENLIVSRLPKGATVYPINWADNQGYKELPDETSWTHKELQVDSALYGHGIVSKSGVSATGSSKGSSAWINTSGDEIDSSIDAGGNMEKNEYGASNNRNRLGDANGMNTSTSNRASTKKEEGNDVSSNTEAGRVKSENGIYQYDDISVKNNDAGWGMEQNELTNYIPKTSHITVSVERNDYEIGSDASAGNHREWDPSSESNPSNIWERVNVRDKDATMRHDHENNIDTRKTVPGPGLHAWGHDQDRKSEFTLVAKNQGTLLQDFYMSEKQEEDSILGDSSDKEKELQISPNEPDNSLTSGKVSGGDDQPSKMGIKILPGEQWEESNQEPEIHQDELHRVSQSIENLNEASTDNEKEFVHETEVNIEGLLRLKEDQENISDETQQLSSKLEDNGTSIENQSENGILITDASGTGETSLKHPTFHFEKSVSPNTPAVAEYTFNPIKTDLHKHEKVTSGDSLGSSREDTGEHGPETKGESGGHDSVRSTKDQEFLISELSDQDWLASDEHSGVNLGEINVVFNTPLTRSPANAYDPLDEMKESTKSHNPLSPAFETRPASETDEGIAEAKFAKKLQPSFGKFAKPQAEIVNKSETSSLVSPSKFKSHSDEAEPARSVESSSHASSNEVFGAGNKNGDLCTVLGSIFLPANKRDNEAPSFDESTRVTNDELQSTFQPNEEQVDVYIVKQTLEGPVQITHVEEMVPLVVTSNVISESAYEKMIDIFERSRVQSNSPAA